MKAENKDQKEHQQDLEKKSNEVEGSGKYTEILSRVIHEGRKYLK